MRINPIAIGALTTLILCSPLSFAKDPVAERESRMKSMGDINRNFDMMVKGRLDFDLQQFAAGVMDIQRAMDGMLDLFPEGSGGEDTSAKEKIWHNWEDFTARNQASIDALAQLSAAVTSGDEDDIEDTFKRFNKTCKSCHRKYRTKQW